MSVASLVVLAAGSGTRYGGPKQLVAVRDDGATITDVLIERATAAGIERAVVVVSDAVADAVRDHLTARDSDATVVRQGGTRGTAQALAAAETVTTGPVVVANADDLYPTAAFEMAAAHLAESAVEHAVVGFPVARTLHGNRPQSRALLTAKAGRLTGVREGKVIFNDELSRDALHFAPQSDTATARGVGPGLLAGDELVSMNLWALGSSVFGFLSAALERTQADEVYLPDVIGEMIAAGDVVRLLRCDAECRGITFPEDVATLESLL